FDLVPAADRPALRSFPPRRSSDLSREDDDARVVDPGIEPSEMRYGHIHDAGHLLCIADICNGVSRLASLLAEIIADLSQHSFIADRKSTRLNSSHVKISYAVFCLN